MAKKLPAQAPLIDVSVPTMLRTRLPDGRLLGVDGSVWLIRRVPLEPVVDAKSIDERMNVFTPLLAAYDELAAMTPVSVTRRAMARKDYRQTQLLMVNLKRLYTPTGHEIAGFLKRSFPNQWTEKRLLFLAVKLESKVGGAGGLKAAIESITETLTVGGAPLSDYDVDRKKVDAALARCGLTTPTSEELSIANSWWNLGHFPDTVDLPHSDHLHVFSDAKAVRMAEDAGRSNCHEWPEIPNHRTLTFATLEDFEFDFIAPTDTKAHWATGLLDDDAVAISIRGSIEPAKITRGELRRQRKRYMDDIRERVEQHKMERAEQDEMLQTLEDVEGVYGSNGGSPTLVDASVLIAFNGEIEDITQAGGNSEANLRIMNFRQRQALAEMMLCSYIRANPNLHDLPSQTVACSGIQSLSTVGDRTGAVLGFTERDQQPAYVSPTAASTADGLPIFLNVGGTGSGKSQVLLWKAVQYSELGGPQVIIDPKALALGTRIPTPHGWTTMGDVKVGDTVIGRDGKPCNVVHKSRIFTAEETHLYEFILDDGQVIKADSNHMWVVTSAADRRRNARGCATVDKAHRDIAALQSVSAAEGENLTGRELAKRLQVAGFSRWGAPKELARTLRQAGLAGHGTPAAWDTAAAVKVLIGLLEASIADLTEVREMTTEQILAEGVLTGSGQSNWAIPVPKAVQFPAASLPVDPYLLGAWLGDGTSKNKDITVGKADAEEMTSLIREVWPRVELREGEKVDTISCVRDTERCLYGHDDAVQVSRQVRCATCERIYQEAYRKSEKADRGEPVNPSLQHQLREAGVLGDKHIPDLYLRSSAEQRLELLRGLMDTDGTVKTRGECKLTFTNLRLAEGSLELVRSLGIKANFNAQPAVITEADPENPGTTRRRQTGTAFTIAFRTSLRVFKLARKDALQPAEATQRSKNVYIKEIRPVEAEDAQCIRVDSPDHTYLVEGYVVTHNTGSDHSPTVLGHGGQVNSLDDLANSDGVFDPIRFSLRPEVGVEMAASMLSAIDPWGGNAARFEVAVYNALSYGVANGAQCVGQALKISLEAGKATLELVQPIFDLADASPMFRACVGMNPKTQGLRIHDGITLIKVGDSHLDLPEPGAIGQATLMQRVCLALVRMMVFGSAMALTGRGGAIHLDEAWVFLGAGKSEVERLGRLARSQNVLPELYTQRVSDALKAELTGYISRGLILPVEDPVEARAACLLFKLDPTPERMARITAKSTIGDGESVAPNWASMKALKDPDTNKVLRGAIGIYADLAGRAVPVEIVLPKSFLALSSTNPDDIRRRQEAALALL